MEEQDKYIQALIELHRGLERKGPGDTEYANYILSLIPDLSEHPRIADIGCGAGVGTLFLAEKFKAKVRAVDFSRYFLDELEERSKQRGLDHLVETVECDMGNLDWEPGTIDLLWSEGAAYCITFDGAMKAWRPLMAPDGIAVVSEMNYFTDQVPEPVKNYMQSVYPDIKSEPENSEIINSSGFELMGAYRLPTNAWWDNYYGPLRINIESFRDSDDSVMQSVIRDTEEEMSFFEKYEDVYGYSFYIMKAV